MTGTPKVKVYSPFSSVFIPDNGVFLSSLTPLYKILPSLSVSGSFVATLILGSRVTGNNTN